MSKRKGKWASMPAVIVLPDTPEGKAKAERHFRNEYGKRYAGLFIDGYVRNNPAMGAIYKPRLKAANFV